MRRFAGLALALSLVVHAAFVLFLWLLPGVPEGSAGFGSGDITLVMLDDPAPRGEEHAEPPPTIPVNFHQDPLPTQPATGPEVGPRIVPPAPGPSAPAQPAPSPSPRSGSLPTEPAGRSVVYLFDRSLSMGLGNTLTPARRELRACLESLPSTCRFQVIPYNLQAEPLFLQGRQDLVLAEPSLVRHALAQLDNLRAESGTNHLRALKRGLQLRPDALYLITDSLDMPEESLAEVRRLNQKPTTIHVLELVRSRQTSRGVVATRLAERNHGTYRQVVLP
jgi:hypothetical protein